MITEKQTLLLVKGSISELPEADRAKIKDAYDRMRTIMAESPEHGMMAAVLIGAEMAVE